MYLFAGANVPAVYGLRSYIPILQRLIDMLDRLSLVVSGERKRACRLAQARLDRDLPTGKVRGNGNIHHPGIRQVQIVHDLDVLCLALPGKARIQALFVANA
jgi:hypothetical protein